jgi:hypothetical protein
MHTFVMMFLAVVIFMLGFGMGRDYQVKQDDKYMLDEFLREESEDQRPQLMRK